MNRRSFFKRAGGFLAGVAGLGVIRPEQNIAALVVQDVPKSGEFGHNRIATPGRDAWFKEGWDNDIVRAIEPGEVIDKKTGVIFHTPEYYRRFI